MRSFMIKGGGLKFLVLFAVVAAVCAVAVAENSDKNAEKKEVLTTLQQRMLKKISIDFRDMPIEDVIRAMAAQADMDIVKSPKVTGHVTATLTDVPLEEALNNILVAHGYGYVISENMIRIAPLDEIGARSEMLVSRIYRITYADVKGVEAALRKFISGQGSLSSNPGTSNIIVTDTKSKIKAIDSFIKEIDRMTPQILVEVRIYDITSQETLDLGIEWQAGRNTTIAATVGSNPTAGRKDPFMIGNFTGATSKTSSTTGTVRLGWLNSSIDIDTMLKAQQEISSAKLLANPRILVLDNETANFEIIREIPYVESTTLGSGITETVKFKEVGVTLEVTPHVTRDGMLRLHIIPEFGVVASSEGGVPTVDTRMIDTIALVKDHQTVVLGGLRKKDVNQQVNKIPLLGDLPLVGRLFRFEGEDTTVTELVIFITPRIIEQPVLSETEKRAYESTEFSGPEPGLTRAEKANK